MPKAFDISKYAATLNRAAPAEARDIETITAEIIQLQQDAGNAIIGIGKRLIEAKAMIPHGDWLPWLAEEVGYSERVAQSFMRLAREWESNPKALSDLGATKALKLLVLPPEERETFMAESHLVDGEEKSVIDMTSRELERAIKERDAARQEAEAARADAQTAEESRAKMESDLKALTEIHRAAKEGETQAREALEKAEAELVEARRQLDAAAKAEKSSIVNQNGDLAMFNVLFSQTQEQVNKMHGLRLKLGKADGELDEKLKTAINALADAVRRCAE